MMENMCGDNFDYFLWEKEIKKFKKTTHKNNNTNSNFKPKYLNENVTSSFNFSEIPCDKKKDFLFSSSPISKTNADITNSNFTKKKLRNIKIGKIKIDSFLDLHNFIEKEARFIFFDFIETSYLKQYKYLLIITGKGNGYKKSVRDSDNQTTKDFFNDGVLYCSFFKWIENYKVNPYIISYSHANQEHGGTGAFYIEIKRKKLN